MAWCLSCQSNMEYYTMCKSDFNYEKYLDFISITNVKRCFSQFRISSHLLEIELSRYNNIGRNERKCKICNNNNQNISSCYVVQFYYDLRREYNMRCNWPNLTRFKNLLSSQKCY